MIKFLHSAIFTMLFFGAVSCKQKEDLNTNNLQIAFMADVHLQDIYGEFQDNDYRGVKNPGNGKFVLIRTMQAQLNSTRIFNENYFAFLAALDDAVKRGVKYIVLPGDFSDDGQPLNVRGLKRILDEYSEKYGIKFIATTGNHDPVRPFSMDAGKTDFLGEEGKPQAIMSNEGMYIPGNSDEYPVVVTRDIRTMGYEEIIEALGDFGFFPKKDDLYWETPFTNYDYENYSFEKALKQSAFDNRKYSIPPYSSSIPDVSYLVEPEKDLWFLAIDANVYVPSKKIKSDPENPANYATAGIGYDNVLTHKKHLIDWVKKVTDEAERLGKTLIVFSHYPMVDFNDDASLNIKELMGEEAMQLHRVPQENVARIFANAGIKLHFGGHMHINDTGVRKYGKENSLVNIQIPSLAAYIPAYKLVTVYNRNLMEVETVIIDSVPRFKELFPLYEKEYAYLLSMGEPDIWNRDILTAENYHDFTNWHLKELVRLRFLKNDWPVDFKNFLLNSSGKDLLEYSNISTSELDVSAYENWTGFDMIFDFYRLHSADKLAIKDIGRVRIKQYQLISNAILNTLEKGENDTIKKDFQTFVTILNQFMNGAPADHFRVDLIAGEVIDLTE